MEPKEGQQAVSHHRLLALITYVICMFFWLIFPEKQIPDPLLYTLWGLLGINGGTKVLSMLGQRK
jgi:hypothetical protein